MTDNTKDTSNQPDPPGKPPRKKKAAKKKATKKAAKKKVTRKPAAKKKADPPARSNPHPDRIDTQVQVWEAYARLRSARAVARELGISDWVVRDILAQDRPKIRRMIEDYIEQFVAEYEQAGLKALGMVQSVLALFEALLYEINRAAKEGRMSVVRDPEGFPMPVLSATELVVMSRMLDQISAIAQKSHAISTPFRRGETLPPAEATDHTPGSMDFAKMTDQQIADTIEAAGLTLPPILAAKVRRIREQNGGDTPPAA